MSMPGYYTNMDALLVSSSEETAGLPAMEAAAAHRLTVSTKVGYFNQGAGEVCRMNDSEFIEDAVNAIQKYRDPAVYSAKCLEYGAYAKANYDWKHHVDAWVKLFY